MIKLSTPLLGLIGVDFRFRNIKNKKLTVRLNLWDTAGQERFKTITSAYYRGADGIVVLFDVTNQESFRHLEGWLSEVNRYASPDNTKRILVGNKVDKNSERVISLESAKEFAGKYGMKYIETSAKVGTNVDQAFNELTEELLKFKIEKRQSTASTAHSVHADVSSLNAKSSKSSCC